MNISMSAAGVSMLGLDPTVYGPDHNTTILYWQGPIQSKIYPFNPRNTVLATYKSEINYEHSQWTTGEMVGTPALLTTTHGAGRVLISSPHPEETVPMNMDLILGYVQWTAGAI